MPTYDYSRLPANMRGGMQRYLEQGLRPGGCLTAILANDLLGAVGRADETTLAGLWSICAFIHSHAPGNAYGSYEAVDEWCKAGGINRGEEA
ncbi:MAG: hypothetical protein CL484_03110 [Acidobacteria bacterium]|nr:hypothetical protein [Acidobacteriota bacterium]|tara:strand:+ start:565 stop:840 length:276 start_codon:yes stop_codon:yes gene_type:complete